MKKVNLILKKCKTLSRQLGRSSSYSSLRSKSTREDLHQGMNTTEEEHREIVFVGSSRRRYMISAKHLNHPLINALIEKSSSKQKQKQQQPGGGGGICVKCEVVLFDHLLWMLENADPNITSDSLEELAELYTY